MSWYRVCELTNKRFKFNPSLVGSERVLNPEVYASLVDGSHLTEQEKNVVNLYYGLSEDKLRMPLNYIAEIFVTSVDEVEGILFSAQNKTRELFS
jgi:hypothetical protein